MAGDDDCRLKEWDEMNGGNPGLSATANFGSWLNLLPPNLLEKTFEDDDAPKFRVPLKLLVNLASPFTQLAYSGKRLAC